MPTVTPFINFKLKDLVREPKDRPLTDTEVHNALQFFLQQNEEHKLMRIKESKALAKRKNKTQFPKRSPNAIIERRSKG